MNNQDFYDKLLKMATTFDGYCGSNLLMTFLKMCQDTFIVFKVRCNLYGTNEKHARILFR